MTTTRERLEADGWTFVPENESMIAHYEKNGAAFIPGPEYESWQLAEDGEPPTQYHLTVVAETLVATSKDHAYRYDEKANVWVKLDDPNDAVARKGEPNSA